jgi:glutathione S-transferase
MYELYIANKNYSSWSLRPWVLMRELAIPFTERLVYFGHLGAWDSFRKISSSGKVPCLVHGDIVVWDSLAIVEYLAERHATVWPKDPVARAWARSASAEMHSGFAELRNRCSMNCGVRVRLHDVAKPLERDVERLGSLWNEGLRRFGGPFLTGPVFTAVDAFFAPVAFRVQTYSLALDGNSMSYVARLLALPAMQDWYATALRETLRDAPHELELQQAGKILEDLRATGTGPERLTDR